MIPMLQTERLILRAPRWEDFETYAAFRGSERASAVGGPYSRAQAFEQLCAILGHWHLRGYGRWMVADKDTDAPLGIVGLYYPEDWPEPELAWSVFGESEGRGIAREAALTARAYAYDTLGWTTLMSLIDPINTRSVALARRLGCTEGETYDHPTYGTMYIWRHPAPVVAA
ncbi:MAG: GNAT family N-acetyltransferase [Paracoccaceae bacterium]|nr:GNAT family N-acetyltransferase [Paracoccaceae bacterium]